MATDIHPYDPATPVGQLRALLNDDAEYRVRHVVTGGIHHPEALFASTGTAV